MLKSHNMHLSPEIPNLKNFTWTAAPMFKHKETKTLLNTNDLVSERSHLARQIDSLVVAILKFTT